MKERVREMMPERWWSVLHDARSSLQNEQPRIFGKSPVTARLYYTFSTKFGREMRAVMAGRAAILPVDGPGSRYRLRRNVHRIEKGLISRPRRANFATSYIAATIDTLDAYLAKVEDPNSDPLAVWASAVLTEYFLVNEPHPVIDAAGKHFEQCNAVQEPQFSPATPYIRTLGEPPVEFPEFLDLSHRRRSVRWYTDGAVPRDLVDKAIAAAAQAPSACNRQPFAFRVFDDPELAKKIALVPGGAAGFADGLTGVIVLVGDLSAFASERDRHLIYIDSSLAAMGFMLGAETLGFSTCPLNWPDTPGSERALRRLIKLESYERPIMLIAYGFPDPEGPVASSVKRPLAELRTYNEVE